MAAERPKRRITQPCLEYNGGLLHKEEIMLRRALYASLTESRKSQQSRMPHVQPSASLDSPSYRSMQNNAAETKKGNKPLNEKCTVSEEWFKNSGSVSALPGQNELDSSNKLLVKGPDKKKKKIMKEPGKLLNYVIKKKKKITKCRTILKSPSPEQLQALSKSNTCTSSKEQDLLSARTDSAAVPCVTELKRKRRQRGALAVFVAMNKSIGGKTNNVALDKRKQLKTLKKRKRLKRKNNKTMEASFSSGANGVEKAEENQQSGVESEESPVKKPKREQKKPTKVVHAQRKFARTHPLGSNSLKLQEENNYVLATVCSRAKTEDFLTFLCLRNTAVLPKELEIFNNPCLPMSPLSEEDEDNSFPPSPAQSQSSMSNSSNSSNLSNPSSAMQKTNSESPALSVDSPAVGDRPCWESGVVRMYADGPKGIAGESKVEKKFEEPLPSDEADDQREMCKSVTPPLSFRVSPHPTIWAGYGAKERQLPKPIPKPFVMNPLSLTRDPTSATHCSAPGNGDSPVPPPLLKPTQGSSSCSPPPPPLLYIPAAAQRVTHLHGPPTLQRYPSTSPTRDKQSYQQKSSGLCDSGPPPLKRFPPIVIEDESPTFCHEATRGASNEAFGGSSAPTGFNRHVAHSLLVGVGDADRAIVSADANRPPTCLSDGTSVSDFEELHESAKPLRGEKMPLLRRYSSTTLDIEKRVDEHFELSIKSRALNSRSSPPRLQRIHTSVRAGIAGPSDRFGDSLRATTIPSRPPALLRHSPLESVLYRNWTNLGCSRTVSSSQPGAPPVLEKAPQNDNGKCFAEAICFKPILVREPPASLEVSTGLVFTKEKWKSTYVFSNRQTVLPAEKQPRRVRMTSVVAPRIVDIPSMSELGQSNSMPTLSRARAVPAGSDVPNAQFVRLSCSNALRTTSPHTQANHQESSPSNAASVVSIAKPLLSVCSSSSPLNSKRVPSPRSDLFGNVISKSIDKFTVYSSPAANSSDMCMTLRSTARQKGNTLRSLPPVWCHMESSYSTASVASSPTPPLPYTFSVTLPTAKPSPLYSKSCTSSHSNTYRVSSDSLGSTVAQRVPVIQRSTLSGETPSNLFTDREFEQDVGSACALNASHHPLPEAFQNEATHKDAKADGTFTESSTFDLALLSSASRNDHEMEGLDMAQSSPPQRQSSLIQSTTRKPPDVKGKGKSLFCDKEITKDKRPAKSSSPKHSKKLIECLLSRTADSPVFRPTEEEFKNPVVYMKAIRSTVERFGVCVIVPPESWKPEFQNPEGVRFNTDCQLIHRLLHRWGPVQEELACIKKHLEQQSICLTPLPQIGGCELDLPQFSRVVKQFGGLQKVIDSKKWTKVADMLKIPRTAQDRVGKLQDIYCKYLLSYDLLPQEEKAELLKQVNMERENNIAQDQDSRGWTLKGRNMSLVPFQRLARNVQGHFFKNPPSANDVEREFWRIVHKRESYVSVHRGTVDTNQEFSCFPNDNGDPHSKHGWNLNVFPHLPGSVLKHLGFVPGITLPWLQFDMTFSVKSWQTHPLALFTVDYLHTGADKIWYSVPAHEREKFVSVLRSSCTREDLDAPETGALDNMVSPSTLKDSGVVVTRVVQEQGQFIVVSPAAYYSSISCGYSVSEAVAFAPPDWIILASQRWEELRGSCQWSDFTFDKLLLGLAEELSDESREVVECVLTKLKMLRDEEKASMNKLLELGLFETQAVNEKNTEAFSGGKKGKRTSCSLPQVDSTCVLFCEDCDQPCYLSAVTREEEPIVLCLKHAAVRICEKQSSKGFRILNRYDASWLDELVDKVEERLKKFGNPS